MKYQIEITGMHCLGCSNFIKMSLEDKGLTDVIVDLNTNSAIFGSNLNDISVVKQILDKVFSLLPTYSYDNIQCLNDNK